ncbi:uncharacterized protein LOC121560319, partial [Coregonus clupeaformis]|uniref:uncharacterized protein LOC121560319 n=1 Tax=Coregonus clupeaformis TaxID=59861 RepID=UPI001E1C6206
MNRFREEAASEKERKPAGEESEEPSSKLPSTFSEMLTPSGKKRRLEEKLRFMKRRGRLAEANRDEQSAKLPRTSSYGRLTPSGKKRRLEEKLRFMKEEAASEMERKPAGEESGELPSTSSGMPRTIFSQWGYPPGPPPPSFLSNLGRFSGSSGQLRSQRTLAVPALLLTTLEEMNPQELKTFQSFLTSGLLPDCPPIPESQLENDDIQVIVGQMVKTYGPERAVEITLRILRGMKRVDLAEKLETDHRGGTASTSHLPLFPPGLDPSSPLCGYPPFPPFSPALSSSQCGYHPGPPPPFFLSHLRRFSGSSGQLRSQEEAASEMERKPAGEESGELSSTSSG